MGQVKEGAKARPWDLKIPQFVSGYLHNTSAANCLKMKMILCFPNQFWIYEIRTAIYMSSKSDFNFSLTNAHGFSLEVFLYFLKLLLYFHLFILHLMVNDFICAFVLDIFTSRVPIVTQDWRRRNIGLTIFASFFKSC